MRVYVATCGEYSDYHVVGVFSSHYLAAKAGDNVLDLEVDAEELTYRIQTGLMPYCVRMKSDGGPIEWPSGHADPVAYSLPIDAELQEPQMVDSGTHGRFIYAVVLAHNADHATKICNEFRTAFIASGQWERDE